MPDLDPFDLDEEIDAPSADGSRFSVILHYDPMMVAELAMGADPPEDIAERYGVDEDDYHHLASQDWFQRLVATKRTEFHEQGVLFTAKAGMMAEALLTRLFQQSMAGTIAAPLTVEVAKQLTEIGRLKPQPLNTQPGAAGGGFMINIQVNGSDVISSRAPLVPAPIDVTPSHPTLDATASTISSPAAPTVSSMVSGDSAAAVPSPGSVTQPGGDKTAAKAPHPTLGPAGPSITMDFTPPRGQPPASISNLRTPDFDLRPNPRPAQSAASAFGAGLPSSTKPA